MFAYCNNNPVVFADYDGCFIEVVIPALDGLQQLFEQAVYWWESGGRETAITIVEVIGTVIVYDIAEDTISDVRDSTLINNKININNRIKTAGSKTAGSTQNATRPATSTPATPPNNNNNNNRDPKSRMGTTYNKNGVRVDYETYGNGEGNVHIHVKGQGKFYYSASSNTLFTKAGNLAAPFVAKLLDDPAIQQAIQKALYYLWG